MALSGGEYEHGLGRIVEADDRDHRYLMRSVQPSEEEAPMVGLRTYRRGPALDQGSTGTCVAHAWRSWLDGEPLRTSKGPRPFDLYDECILADRWSDNDHDPERKFGTSVRAGAQVLTRLGYVKHYLWAFNTDDVRRWLLSGQGGVVFGVNWYSEMGRPDAEGFIRANGRYQGGHAIYCFGADDRQGYVFLQNSWSRDWGGWQAGPVRRRVYKGCARLPYEDLDRLIREQGEACTAVQQQVQAVPTLVL